MPIHSNHENLFIKTTRRHRSSTYVTSQCAIIRIAYIENNIQYAITAQHMVRDCQQANMAIDIFQTRLSITLRPLAYEHLPMHLFYICNPSNSRSVGGVTVSMVAFQAVDPGSTPGRRTHTFC